MKWLALAVLLASCGAPVQASHQLSADCVWGDNVLTLDSNLDARTAGANGPSAAYYQEMSAGFEEARQKLASICSGKAPDRSTCITTLDLLGRAAESHAYILDHPEGVSLADLQWHQTWLANYDRLLGLFEKPCIVFLTR